MPDPNPSPSGTPQPNGGMGQPQPTDGGQPGQPPKTYTIKIDGIEKAVTLTELQQLAEKAGGADKKFQEASELRKQAERGIRTTQLIERLTTAEAPDKRNIDELAEILGIDAAEFATAFGTDDDKDKGKTAPAAGTDTSGVITKDKLSPELQQSMAFSEQQQQRQIVQMVETACKEAVDKDEVFGKMINGYEEKSKPEIAETIKKMVFEDVQRKILALEPFGPDMVVDSVQRARATLQKFGIHTRTAGQPITLGLGPSGVLPTEVQASEPIKRVDSNAPNYEENLTNRYLQKIVAAFRGKRG